MTRRDKEVVIDEVWDDDRVQSFLNLEPFETDVNPDFFVLWKSYQSMRAGDFRRLLRFFTEAGRDLDARNEWGQTLAEFISTHRHAGEFIDALIAAGATPPSTRSADDTGTEETAR